MTKNDNLVCPNCKAILLKDSAFCQCCGTEVSTFEDSQLNVSHEELHLELEMNQIENEKNRAILKRIETTARADKKKKIVKFIIIGAIIAIIAGFFISEEIDAAHDAEERNFVTQTMSAEYTNVYADIVLMEPAYFISAKSGINDFGITEIVCKCETIEGTYIWATIDCWEYPGGGFAEESYETQYYSKDKPMRLKGRVTTAKRVMDELESEIGDVFILAVDMRIQ